MKKTRIISAFLAALMLAGALISCNDGNTDETAGTAQSGESSGDETLAEVPTAGDYDIALDNSAVTLYEKGDYTSLTENYASPSSWVFTDGLDRTSSTNADVGDIKDEKYVGIFYSPWHGTFANSQYAYNIQEILDKHPDIDINDYDDERWGKGGAYHFWNEPIYGYYSCKDEWVIRRQAEMLAAAGVDTIICDNTNGTYTWADTMTKVLRGFNEARVCGVEAPKVVFALPFFAGDAALTQLRQLYDRFYAREEFDNCWFMLDGKPLVMMDPAALNPRVDPTHQELLDHFTFRAGQPDYVAGQTKAQQWGWLSVYPQATYTKNNKRGEDVEQITVGVAQNHDYKARVLTAMNGNNVTGRTYTSKGYDTRENAKLYGANFAEQFEYALQVDPKFIFITGYNEWVAIRHEEWSGIENAFADQFNDVNSRDIEPTKGALKDHYYYQMVEYIRQYKGADAVPDASSPIKIDINGGYGQWAEVGPRYISYAGNTMDRAARGYLDPATGAQLQYKDKSGRNDLYDFKVARDNENIYFMARCVENITPYTDEKWMQLYIDITATEASWETFDFILNKQTPKSETVATLEKFTGNGFETEVAGEVEYKVNGNVMMVKIPKSLLGITSNEFTINFKWTDNVQVQGDIMDFYVTGDVAPTGRFKYQYNAK